MSNTNQTNPIQAYAPHDIIRDSKLWDYLRFLQVNRIDFISTTVFDEDKQIKNRLLNQISAISRLEFLCWDEINPLTKKTKRVINYWARKPQVFKNLDEKTDHLKPYIMGDHFQQLKLQIMLDDWLKELNPFLASMKKSKRTSFIAGEGAYLEAQDMEIDFDE